MTYLLLIFYYFITLVSYVSVCNEFHSLKFKMRRRQLFILFVMYHTPYSKMAANLLFFCLHGN